MKRKILLIMALVCGLAAFAEQVIVVKKNDAESLLQAVKDANRMNVDKNAEPLYILIPDGYYDLGNRVLTQITGHHIALIGQSTEGTVVRNAPDFKNEGISKTAVFQNRGTNNYFQDLTLRNDLDYYGGGGNLSGASGRAVCLHDKGDRTICNRVRMLSYQDTYYSDNECCRHYMKDSEIHGTVDFICGAGDVWFERCLIVTEKRNVDGTGRCVIAAPRTSKTPWGYIFHHCTVKNDQSEFDYARGWHTTPHCIWLYTTLLTPDLLRPTRFDPAGMRTVQSDFREYGTMDAAGNDITPQSNVVTFTLKEERNPVETILTAEQVKKYTLKEVFPDWQPAKVTKRMERKARKLMKRL